MMEQKPDLFEVLQAYGVQIQAPEGKRVNALCPFHPENRPSFSVDLKQGLWFCFHEYSGGDAIDFVGAMEYGLQRWDARNPEMFKRVLSILEEQNFTLKEVELLPKEEKTELTQNVLFLLGHVTEIYHQNLLRNKQARDYLHSRGLTDTFIRSRKIGYAKGNLSLMLSLLPGEVYRTLAVEAGLIYVNKENRRWELLKGRVTFPDYDRYGRVWGMIGRTINPSQNPKYLTLVGLPKVIWGLGQVNKQQPLILHESIMDACTALLMGVPSASTCGTGIAWHLIDSLKERAYLGFLSQDDEPSKRAVQRWKEKIPQGRVIYGEYKGCKDLNEMAMEYGWDAARERLFQLLEKKGFVFQYGKK